MSHYKTGRWSGSENQFIIDNYKSMTIDELSKNLNRPPSKVAERVDELNIPEDSKEAELNIRKTHEWKQICQQMNESEQETFLYHWREMIKQFKCDITHTERMQIMDIARTEILINRVLKKIFDCQVSLEDIARELKIEKEKEGAARDTDKIIRLNQIQSDMLMSIGAFQKENQLLTERKQSIMRDTKATRDQRKKRIEDDSKATIKDWVITLIQNPDVRRELGIEIEKFRHACTAEYERLSEYFVYADGVCSQPVLNADNIKSDNI